jgi:hypothetical protein
MFWTKKPPFCGLILNTADTELGQYSILDSTVFAHAGINVLRRKAKRKTRRHQYLGTSRRSQHRLFTR